MPSTSPGQQHHHQQQFDSSGRKLLPIPSSSFSSSSSSSGVVGCLDHHNHNVIINTTNLPSPDGEFLPVMMSGRHNVVLPGFAPDGSSSSSSGCSNGGMSSRDSGYCVNTSDGASTCSSSTTDAAEGEAGTLLVLEPKSLRSFTTNDEYLYAMKEDLADWFSCLYKRDGLNADTFFAGLETGVLLCQHANKVQEFSQQRRELGEPLEMRSYFIRNVPSGNVPCKENVKPETFQARDNVSNFISWGRQLGIPEVLSFETDDLVLRKNEKSVILCLLEIARVGAKLGMPAPTLVQMEEEIDAELAGEEVKPQVQIKTCDMRSLDERVRDLIGRCTCPVQFPMVKVGDGKYKIGDSRSLIFVRILRNHVMVRVGGGWDTLENYLNKHDPCQCNYRGHRATSLGPNRAAQQRQTAANNTSTTPASRQVNNNATAQQSPRRMSTPAVSVTTDRNRSSSPKHQQATRSKSPSLIISRHKQANQKPSFSVNNSNNSNAVGNSSSSSTTTTTTTTGPSPATKVDNELASTMGGGGSTTGTPIPTQQGHGHLKVTPEVSKSWSQPNSFGFVSRVPGSGGSGGTAAGTQQGQGQTMRTKSPSPGPNSSHLTSRLRSPSPLTTATAATPSKLRTPKRIATRAASSSALLSSSHVKGQSASGEVRVGTPRSIKRAAMKSNVEDEDDEYDNEDDDDDDNGNNRWNADNVSSKDDEENDDEEEEEEYQFNCETNEPDDGSVSFEDSFNGQTPGSRSSAGHHDNHGVSESESSSDTAGGVEERKAGVAMEKINTMTLTEFKSLLTTALAVPEDQTGPGSGNRDRGSSGSDISTRSSLGGGGGGGGVRTMTGITSTASTPGASDSNRQLNWDALRDKAKLVRDQVASSVSSRKAGGGGAGSGSSSRASPGIVRRSLPQSPDDEYAHQHGSRARVPYTDSNRPKTPQALRRNSAGTSLPSGSRVVARSKTPTPAMYRSKTPTVVASARAQPRSRTPNGMERGGGGGGGQPPREEYRMARPKTPSQMKRDAVSKVAGAISNWVESQHVKDAANPSATRSRGGVSRELFSDDVDEGDNDEIMSVNSANSANDRLQSILSSSVRDRPSTPSRIPKPSFTPRPATPVKSLQNNNKEQTVLSTTPQDQQPPRPHSVPPKPPQSLSLSQHSFDSSLTPSQPDSISRTGGGGGGGGHSPQTNIPETSSASTVAAAYHQHPAAMVSAPTTPGGSGYETSSRTVSDQNAKPRTPSATTSNTSNAKTYKDIYAIKRATTPTQLYSSSPSSSSSIPRSQQPSRCVTPGPRERWALGERSMSQQSSSGGNNGGSIQNAKTSSSSSRVSRRRASLSSEAAKNEYLPASSPSHSTSGSQFVVTNEITFSDDEEINEMLQNAAMMTQASQQKLEKKTRSASVGPRKLTRQNASDPKEVIVISRNSRNKHSVQISRKDGDARSSSSTSGGLRGGVNSVRSNPARFRSQTPDPSMFHRRSSVTSKSSTTDDVDSGSSRSKSGGKSINRTEAWVDSTLSDTKRKLPPRPKKGKSLGGDIAGSELEPRPLEEFKAILLPETQQSLVHVDTGTLDAPPEDPEMFKKMERLFEKYREMELRASVNEVPGGNKSADGNDSTKRPEATPSHKSFKSTGKSGTPSVSSVRTSSGSVASSSSSSHNNRGPPPLPLSPPPPLPPPSSSSSTTSSITTTPRPKAPASSASSSSSGKLGRFLSSDTDGRRAKRCTTPTEPRSFQKSRSMSPSALAQNKSLLLSEYSGHASDTSQPSQDGSSMSDQCTSLKDIDSETAKDPTALIKKIKEILRVKPRKDENCKVPTRIPAPASLTKSKRSKSVSNLFDSDVEFTLSSKDPGSSGSTRNGNGSGRGVKPSLSEFNRANSTSSTNVAYSEFVFSGQDSSEDFDAVSDSSRSETPVPKLATPLTTGRSTFINRKFDLNGRGLSQDKENGLSTSQTSLSSRSAFSATEDEADYV